MKKLTYEQILMMHEEITGQTGGTAGIRRKTWVWIGAKPCLCGWQQTDRSPCHACFSGSKWCMAGICTERAVGHDIAGGLRQSFMGRNDRLDHGASGMRQPGKISRR